MDKKQLMIIVGLLIVIGIVVAFVLNQGSDDDTTVNLAPSIRVENINDSLIENILFDSKDALLATSVPETGASELDISNAFVDIDTRYTSESERIYIYVIDLDQEITLFNANDPKRVGKDINDQIIDEVNASDLLEVIAFEDDYLEDAVVHLEYDAEGGNLMTTSILKYGDLILGVARYNNPSDSSDPNEEVDYSIEEEEIVEDDEI